MASNDEIEYQRGMVAGLAQAMAMLDEAEQPTPALLWGELNSARKELRKLRGIEEPKRPSARRAKRTDPNYGDENERACLGPWNKL